MTSHGSVENVAACPAALAAREAALLAPYAMHSSASRGRKHAEPPHAYRGPFQRDRDRITHSAAFRRLSDKTQVFTGGLGYHRTRLTHTLEVASISRTLARALALNEDLVEALALAHDLGHPPYGHAGEDALDDCLRPYGGFSHNRQALRIVELLEQRYPAFPGLNLSIEVLEGQQTRYERQQDVVGRPLLEVQVVEAADSVAYDTHDVDDALELGLFTLDDLDTVPLWHQAAGRVRRRWQALSGKELKRAVLHELIDWQVGDLLDVGRQRTHDWALDSIEAVRAAPWCISANEELAALKRELEQFLFDRVYRHAQVIALRNEAQAELRAMFAGYCHRPELLPDSYRARVAEVGLERSVGDYLAGMTDRYARHEYRRLFAP